MDKENESQDDRQKYTEIQVVKLEKEFSCNRYPTRQDFKRLSKTMKISERKIQVWFQNRRARQKRIDRKASGIPENPLPNMLYRLSTNPTNAHNIFGLRKTLQNIPSESNTTTKRKMSNNGLYRRLSNSQSVKVRKMSRRISSTRKTSNSQVVTGSHRRTSSTMRFESHRKTSTSKMQWTLSFCGTSNSDTRAKSIRGLSDVNEDDLESLMQHVDWDSTELDDDVFTQELEVILSI